MRIREDSPAAIPIIAEIDRIIGLGEQRRSAMHPGQTKDLTHPSDLLTSEEKSELHALKMRLRPKSASEAAADIKKRREARKSAT
jgi:hypothetical protein